uniref:Uncharacterized protein n=1 Tax=Aureoumbra lagunensis TaxID=44058 RepID=A0A7S3NPI0_9STRA|mmetsp:Transcript_18156/g.27405  ORF Transcript_18156/g.27405 Transcript_18156/m.27405 type:complete len:326 (+) Transcript_18156:35-1012(+)
MSASFRKLTDVGKRLNVQLVLIDSHLFRRVCGTQQEEVPASLRPSWDRVGTQLQTKDMLVKQVRAELKARNLDSIGKPFEIRKRLQEARDDEATTQNEEVLLSQIMGTTPDERPTTAQEKKKPNEETDLRAKYAARLRAKISSGSNSNHDVEMNEAKYLAEAKKHTSGTNKFRSGPPGLKSLLDFIHARSMLLGLLTRPDTSNTELNELSTQNSFDFILESNNQMTSESVARACKELDIERHKTLVLVDDPAAISPSQRAGAIACLMLYEDQIHNKAAGNQHERWHIPSSTLTRKPDFSVSHCNQVISLINELNGISFRHTVPVY